MTAVRPEYPRPHFDRSHTWLSLNGTWQFFADPQGTGTPTGLDVTHSGQPITVPFAWETEASGVGAHWLEQAWYRRAITVPDAWAGQRVVAHFGAVHHHAEVWVSGIRVGDHRGGYTPFELDITEALAGASEAELVVRVQAPNDKRHIAHGKQRSMPPDDYDDCAFTPSSGIWQPVWLEARPATHISAVAVTPVASDSFGIRVRIEGPSCAGSSVRIEVDGEDPIEVTVAENEAQATVGLDSPRLWSTSDPHLYGVRVTLSSADGTDRVGTHAGLRDVRVDGEHLLLNGERLYVRGVLDQGYWPRTGITAPDDQAFVDDLRLARDAGFNLVRKHLKLEDPRFLHHADRLGMLVWAEPASTGRWSAEGVQRFEEQIEPMVRRDGNHPSIVIWGLYNEEWGLDWDVPADPAKQAALRSAYQRLKRLDPLRPVVDNSGWSHVETDLVDWHMYDDTPAGWAAKVRSLVDGRRNTFPVGLGPSRVVEKHLMVGGEDGHTGRPLLNSEFGGGKTSVERGWNLQWQTLELRRYEQLGGYVWTELYDIEHEMAGIYDFHRQLKDAGGIAPARVNADTVIVPLLEPVGPGRDLGAASGTVTFDVVLSHHGGDPLQGDLMVVWGPPLAELPEHSLTAGTRVAQVKAEPFHVSDPVAVTASLPSGAAAARLHVVLLVEDGIAACTSIDVAP